MRTKYISAEEYSELEVRVFVDYRSQQPQYLWRLFPEKISIYELESCTLCEIVGPEGMLNQIYDLSDRMYDQKLHERDPGIVVYSNKKLLITFGFRYFQITPGGAMLFMLDRSIFDTLSPAGETGKSYAAEEETFFSQFKRESNQ